MRITSDVSGAIRDKQALMPNAKLTHVLAPPPPEDDMPSIAASKTLARQRRHNLQVADLNNTRAELHTGNWDGLILATELNPLSVSARLSPHLAGSGIIVAYSPYVQVLAEVLQYTKKDQNYLNANITESWTRTYQVLPGRTHPLMTTSGTGGYLFHATRVYVQGSFLHHHSLK
jgi:tRNA (adenine-N(1)-)-methyltransferase non-catalytic subunit